MQCTNERDADVDTWGAVALGPPGDSAECTSELSHLWKLGIYPPAFCHWPRAAGALPRSISACREQAGPTWERPEAELQVCRNWLHTGRVRATQDGLPTASAATSDNGLSLPLRSRNF